MVATFGGEVLPATLRLSADQRSLTLFYSRPLPPSARVRVTVDGSLLQASSGSLIDVDSDGVPGGTTTIDFETLTLTLRADTSVCGRVFVNNGRTRRTHACR